MAQLKYWNGSAWVDAVVGAQGPTGATGPTGVTGATGPTGPSGNLAVSQIASGSMPASTTLTISSLSSYDYLLFIAYDITNDISDSYDNFRINGNSGSNYIYNRNTWYNSGPNSYAPTAYSRWTTGSSNINFLNQNRRYNNSNNMFVWELRNCKSAGFTSFSGIAATQYYDTNVSGNQSQTGQIQGIYKVAEAVSSISMINGSGSNYNAGSYVLWGA